MSAPPRESFSTREKVAWGAVVAAFLVALWWHGRDRHPEPPAVAVSQPRRRAAKEPPYPADEPLGEPGDYAGRAWRDGAGAWHEAVAELNRTGDPYLVYFYSDDEPECARVSRRYLEGLDFRTATRAVHKVRLDVRGTAADREVCRLLYPHPPEIRVVRLQPPSERWRFPREETVRVPFTWPTGGPASPRTPYEYGVAIASALAEVPYKPPQGPFPSGTP